MVNFGPVAAEIGPVVWGTPINFTRFRVFFGSVTARHSTSGAWASAKLSGVGQTAPPIFGRAAITLGIGPHFEYFFRFKPVLTCLYRLKPCLTETGFC